MICVKNLTKLLRSTKALKHSIETLTTVCNEDDSPLSGIRVLDLTRIVAGPYCTMILSDLGAEVIKIERPFTGDEARRWAPPFVGDTPETCYFAAVNRNKKSVCVDLKSPKGRDIVYRLAMESDVFVENYLPGKLDELGLGYEDLRKVAPGLVYCSITAYGPRGPYRNRPGYDVIAASRGGLLHITGPRYGEPCKVGVAVTDIATGLYAHGAIMAALIKRSRTSRGQKIDCNLLSTQIASLINIGSNYLNAGKEASRLGTSHESIVPYEAFPTKDGYLTIGTGSDQHFEEFCQKIGYPELSKIERFSKNALRVEHREELIAFLRSVLARKTSREWQEIFEGVSFPFGPVNSLKETFEDPHVKEIGLVETVVHPSTGIIKLVGPPVMYSEGGNCVRSAPPTLGQHTVEVLTEILDINFHEIGKLLKEQEVPRLTLKLRKPRTDRKVQWSTETVDNENMNKKKSKCCCIFNKPRSFGESSSDESDDECDHCHGHVEKKKNMAAPNTSDCVDGERSSTPESKPSGTVPLDN